MLHISDLLKNDRLVFNSKATSYFGSYIGFQNYAVSNLDNLAFQLLEKVNSYPLEISTFKAKREKLYNSQLRF